MVFTVNVQKLAITSILKVYASGWSYVLSYHKVYVRTRNTQSILIIFKDWVKNLVGFLDSILRILTLQIDPKAHS